MTSVSQPTTKQCKRCLQVLAVDQFYYKNKDTGTRFGQCKACQNAVTMARYNARTGRIGDENRRLRKKPEQTTKVCTSCHRLLDATAFHRIKSGRLRPACIECRKAEKQAYDAKHRDRVHDAAVLYRHGRAAELSARSRQWRAAHPERAAAIAQQSKQKHHAAVIAYNRAWRKLHPELGSIYKHNRRTREAGNGGAHTAEQWENVKASYDYHCLRCGKREPDVKLSKDHVIPVVDGGSNDAANLQPLCMPCNQAKGVRHTDYRR